jgi:hypothetical protein
MTLLTRASIAAVLLWARLYTWRMPRSVRQARIAEIESDLWESSRDGNEPAMLPVQIVARLLIGMPDDLRWRGEQLAATPHAARLTLALGVAAAAVLGAVWITLAVGGVESPPAPDAPDLRWRPKNPPPPPPPPPPPF